MDSKYFGLIIIVFIFGLVGYFYFDNKKCQPTIKKEYVYLKDSIYIERDNITDSLESKVKVIDSLLLKIKDLKNKPELKILENKINDIKNEKFIIINNPVSRDSILMFRESLRKR